MDGLQYRHVLTPTDREVMVRDYGGETRAMRMFGSNNYLGLATHPVVVERVQKAIAEYGVGVGGPPALNGHGPLQRELQERLALSRGYVETIFGRRRPFNFDRNGLGRLLGKEPLEINLDVARRGGMEAQQLRAAANAPIQGSSADIIKVAMVQLQAALQNQGLPAQLLLQVHDELVLEVQADAMETTRELVRQTMENAVQLSVPLVAETGEGANWMETK